MKNSNMISRLQRLKQNRAYGEDLTGTDISGILIENVSLRNANLYGADLSGSYLIQVDLSGANLSGADLRGANFELTNLEGAVLDNVKADRSIFTQCRLSGGRFLSAFFRSAMFRVCDCERADFSNTNLSRAKLLNSFFGTAIFSNTQLLGAATFDSSFPNAQLGYAINFFRSREMIAEILQPYVENDMERAKLVGAILTARQVCFGKWKTLLANQTEYRDLAMRIFKGYPYSGLERALREGWTSAVIAAVQDES